MLLNLGTLILSSVSPSHQNQIQCSFDAVGVVETFFSKVYQLWSPNQKKQALEETFSESEGVYKTILFDGLGVNKTIEKYYSHKKFIMKVYQKYRNSFPNISQETIEAHDKSKRDTLIELVGYTARYNKYIRDGI